MQDKPDKGINSSGAKKHKTWHGYEGHGMDISTEAPPVGYWKKDTVQEWKRDKRGGLQQEVKYYSPLAWQHLCCGSAGILRAHIVNCGVPLLFLGNNWCVCLCAGSKTWKGKLSRFNYSFIHATTAEGKQTCTACADIYIRLVCVSVQEYLSPSLHLLSSLPLLPGCSIIHRLRNQDCLSRGRNSWQHIHTELSKWRTITWCAEKKHVYANVCTHPNTGQHFSNQTSTLNWDLYIFIRTNTDWNVCTYIFLLLKQAPVFTDSSGCLTFSSHFTSPLPAADILFCLLSHTVWVKPIHSKVE